MASDASAGKGRRVPVGFFTADTDPDVILDAIDAALASLPPGTTEGGSAPQRGRESMISHPGRITPWVSERPDLART